jgi:hypothetical protein
LPSCPEESVGTRMEAVFVCSGSRIFIRNAMIVGW